MRLAGLALTALCVLQLARWLRERRGSGGAPEGWIGGFVVLGVGLVAALGCAMVVHNTLLRTLSLGAGLAAGPLVLTAGVVAYTSRRFHHSTAGPLLMLLGALIGALIFVVGRS